MDDGENARLVEGVELLGNGGVGRDAVPALDLAGATCAGGEQKRKQKYDEYSVDPRCAPNRIFGARSVVPGRFRRFSEAQRFVSVSYTPRMQLVDIGANLTHSAFASDLDEVLARARRAGVAQIIVTGTTVEESRHAAALADSHPGVLYATAGVHPHHARDCTPQTITDLRELAKHPRCVAIGECGLDFNRNYSPHPDQEKWFVAQLELGIELGKPLFLHSRDAHPRFAEILKNLKYEKQWRTCFTGERKN